LMHRTLTVAKRAPRQALLRTRCRSALLAVGSAKDIRRPLDKTVLLGRSRRDGRTAARSSIEAEPPTYSYQSHRRTRRRSPPSSRAIVNSKP
jgi:hypothetical protein